MIRGARQGLHNLRRRAIARSQSTCCQKLLRQQRASQGQANALQSAEPSEPMQRPRTFDEFWPHYVLAHRHPVTRAFHFTGTQLAWGLVVAAILLRNGWLVVAALVVPYALASFSHFFVEHNRPATFRSSVLVLAGRSEDAKSAAVRSKPDVRTRGRANFQG